MTIKKRDYPFTIIPNSIIRNKDLSSSEFRIYVTVAMFLPDAFPSFEAIAEISGLSRSTVKRAIALFKAKDFFVITKRGRHNVYNLRRDEPTRVTHDPDGDSMTRVKFYHTRVTHDLIPGSPMTLHQDPLSRPNNKISEIEDSNESKYENGEDKDFSWS